MSETKIPKPNKSLTLCAGCKDNFYNGHNDIGVDRCWSFAKAKVIKRIKIPYDQRPPYDIPAQWMLSCRKERGYAMTSPKALTKEGFWK